MLDDLRQFATDVHTIAEDFRAWAGQLWWLAALALLVGLVNMAMLGYLIWMLRNRMPWSVVPAPVAPAATFTPANR